MNCVTNRRGARLHPQGRKTVRSRDESHGGSCQARRDRIPAQAAAAPPSSKAAAMSISRSSARRRWKSRDDLRQSSALGRVLRRATSSSWSLPPVIAATARRSARRSASASRPTRCRRFWDEIVLPGFEQMVDASSPATSRRCTRRAVLPRKGRAVAADPRPRHRLRHRRAAHLHRHVQAEAYEQVLKPGMVLMTEPNPVTADGMFGIFFGHTFIITETGSECVDDFRGSSRWRELGAARSLRGAKRRRIQNCPRQGPWIRSPSLAMTDELISPPPGRTTRPR